MTQELKKNKKDFEYSLSRPKDLAQELDDDTLGLPEGCLDRLEELEGDKI